MKNQHKICLILFIFCIYSNACVSQDLVDIPNIPLPLGGEYEEDQLVINERYNKIKKYKFETLSGPSKDIYDWISATYHLYILKDSSNYYFNRMLQRSPRRVCRLLLGAEKNHKRRIHQGDITQEMSWFLHDLPNENPDEILKYCQDYMVSLYGEPKPPKEEILSGEIKKVKIRDHKYRIHKDVDWFLQDRLDSINRVVVDSLFNVDRSLQDFSTDELFIFSIVLHHSTDCEWNMRWTEIFFEEIKTNDIKGADLLQEAIRRWFKPNTNNCYSRDSEKVKLFIANLRQKYPKLSKFYFSGFK